MNKIVLDTENTGRFIVSYNNRKFLVEPIGNPKTNFGDINPATKQVEGGYGSKYKGSIKESESIITIENGFGNIFTLSPGESPISFIEQLINKDESTSTS